MKHRNQAQAVAAAISEYGTARKLAARIGVSPQIVSFWLSGSRSVSPRDAAQIELATAGKVKRQALRPADWREIWPEICPPKANRDQPKV